MCWLEFGEKVSQIYCQWECTIMENYIEVSQTIKNKTATSSSNPTPTYISEGN